VERYVVAVVEDVADDPGDLEGFARVDRPTDGHDDRGEEVAEGEGDQPRDRPLADVPLLDTLSDTV
jgi:hypothetical protein